jgi:alkylation response protein AidB-like acyl-CoA dehydrogenase
MIGAIAMTEPGTGSDLQSVKTKALLDGDEYVITGSRLSSPTANRPTSSSLLPRQIRARALRASL